MLAKNGNKTKIKILILMIVFTAVMVVLSTYAWFSAQKSVSISNLEGTVNVGGTLVSHTNFEPTELMSVSTTWKDTGVVEMAMYRGDNTNIFSNS